MYLAEGAVFADAVSGRSLTDGPILLVPTSGDTPPSVAAEIERVDPDTVIALGGIQAIEEEVLTDDAAGRPTSRIFGANRITTAIGSERSFPNGAEEVYLARADVFADAVVAGVLTAGPVLLVPTCGELPASVSDAIESLDPETVTALGGEEAVCTGILDAASADPDGGTRGTNRLFGISRIDTAVAISSFEFSPESTTALYLARADIFADAVVGGTLTNGPILLVPSCGDLPTVVGLEVQARDPDTVIALGGVEAVCDDILDEAAAQ